MSHKTCSLRVLLVMFLGVSLVAGAIPARPALAADLAIASLDPTPPAHPVKLIFVHHSTGQNWLADDYGGLGNSLGANNYFVSDTNYGWGPDKIGDRTDIPNWTEWFRSGSTPTYMAALYAESGQHSSYTRTLADPGGQNTIIMFKSCFPNSNLEGNPDDPPDPDGWLTVGHAKYVYNQILQYFGERPDKLFIVITAPPLSDATRAANARAFNNWLVNDWLASNAYPFHNVAVFDFYNVLTDADAHHRYDAASGTIQHIVGSQNTLYYPSGDDHPNAAGSQKATTEFLPLLNIFYNQWVANDLATTATFQSGAAEDGWVRETREASNRGGRLDSAASLVLGDNATRQQFRAILSFDTGATLPDNAVITTVQVRIKRQAIAGRGNPVNRLQGLKLDLVTGAFGLPTLEARDFQLTAGSSIYRSFGPFKPTADPSGWYTLSLPDPAGQYINRLDAPSALTQIRLRFKLDDNNDGTSNRLVLYSGNAAPEAQPQLVVRYYVP